MIWGFSRRRRSQHRPSSRPRLEFLEDRTAPSVFWGGFASTPQHTAQATVATQPLNQILWHTPVDQNPPYQGGDLLVHYGSPVITQANTVIVPVTRASGGFEVDAHNGATGSLMWSQSTDYSLPPHDWVPSYSPVLTANGRLYFAGAGGTIYFTSNLDSTSPSAPTQIVYYGASNYAANPGAFNSTVFVNTPLTADSNGDIFFGVRVTGSNPSNLKDGIVRIGADGSTTWVSAASAAGDSQIGAVPHNMAPALSNDQTTLYVGVRAGSTQYYGYLLGLDSTTLATKDKVFLWDPRSVGSQGAGLLDDGTSSPMVGPDGDVYYGVMGNPYNGSRGWLLHFNSTLTQTKTPGAFGWDSTPALVPASMVPNYSGTSTYLLFEKYNNYAGVSDGGDGLNQIALLDPNATMTEPHASSNGLQVMQVYESIPGPMPDPSFINSGYPNAVREWCINTSLVDPFSKSIVMPSEDGNLYRWDLGSNTLDQVVTVNPTGIGEAYVPTLEGPDGTVYTIENAQLYAVGGLPGGLSVSVTSVQNPTLYGGTATFNATVTSSGSTKPTGTVTFKDGSTALATVPVDTSGNASYSTKSLAYGHRFITAAYSGDSHYVAGSMTLVQAVKMTTTVTLTSSPNPSAYGQAVTLTATVTTTVAVSNVATGTVVFRDHDSTLGFAAVNSSGQAILTISTLGPGTHPLFVSYQGDSNFNGSGSTIVNQTVGPAIIDNGASGYSETGGPWTTETVPSYGGNERYAPSSGNGSTTATWQVSSVPFGYYSVQVSWHPYPNEATNAPYAIYDGNTLLQTVLVNQTQPASGASFGGVPFQILASVKIANGTLKVVLNNSGNGTYIVADAVRVAPLPVTNTDLNWSASGDGVSGPSSVATQTPFTLNRTFTISGAAAPNSFTIAYYASTSSSLTQDLTQAIFLGKETISAAADLTVGNHAGASPQFQFQSSGTYYFLAKLNADISFVESDGQFNDTNNVAASSQTVLVSGPTIVDNGTPGYSETGGPWLTESVPSYGGSERYTASSGSGSSTATWQVTGLPVGQYQVQASWHPYANESSNAPYAIYDGNTLLQTVPVNQRMAASGTSYGGVPFQLLATVTINSGTIRVVLNNSGDGAYVVADAVRIAPPVSSNTDLNWSDPGDGISGPATASPQTPFTISRMYTVSGAAAPSSFTIAYYASTSSDINQNLSNAMLLGKETISAASDLAVGDHAGTSPQFQFQTLGTYYLLARLNADNSFLESDGANDTNNVTASAQSVLVSGPVIVDNGSPGYSEAGGPWLTESVPSYGGSERYTASSGSGSSTATWQVTGLPAGQYQVQASWHPYPNESTNAPYVIYDGNTLLQTVLVNQTQPANGGSYGGVPFQLLATVTVNSGTLRVVLNNSGNGTYVVADGVRVAPLMPSNTDLNWSDPGDGISGPAAVNAQTPFTISRTYSVSGAAAPSSFTIAYFASTSSNPNQDLSQATLLGKETISAASDLAVGVHSGTSPQFQFQALGTYYFFAKLNADNSFIESDGSNDTNDVTGSAQPVVVSGPLIVDNGAPGYSETGGPWFTEAVPSYGGTERYAASSGSGASTAVWQVTNLQPGQYQVQVSWHPYGNEPTNAPYAIYDGSTLLTTVLVDQTKAANGTNYGGVPFQTLATLNITSGTLRVVLSNSGNGVWVVADAMRVAPA
jgi:hypothetical protein